MCTFICMLEVCNAKSVTCDTHPLVWGLSIRDVQCCCRFVTLIDVLYENQIRLFCSADADPMELFQHIVTVSDARRLSKTNMVSQGIS